MALSRILGRRLVRRWYESELMGQWDSTLGSDGLGGVYRLAWPDELTLLGWVPWRGCKRPCERREGRDAAKGRTEKTVKARRGREMVNATMDRLMIM